MAHHTIASPPAGSVLEMAPGDVLSVLLPERGGGYRWRPVFGGGVLSLEEDRTETTSGPPDHSGRTRVFRLRAHQPGRVAVSFVLCRDWQDDEPPPGRHDLEIEVR